MCGTRVAETATRCIVCGAELGAGTQPVRTTFESQVQAVTLAPPARIGPPVLPPDPELPDPPLPTAREQVGATSLLAAIRQLPTALFAAVGGMVTLLLVTLGAVLVVFSGNAAQADQQDNSPAAIASAPPTFTPMPAPSSTPPPTNTPLPPLTHLAQDGDSCTGLAAIYDVSVESILKLNGLTQNCDIRIGQEVFIPQPTHTPDPALLALTPLALDPFRETRYVVEEGDTLYSIADRHGLELDVLASANEIEPPDYAITIGQELTIPSGRPRPAATP